MQAPLITYLFHLASPASPIDYQNFPLETLLVNSKGTVNMLVLARDSKAKILIASTSEVYGDLLEHPQKETYRGNVNTYGPNMQKDDGRVVSSFINWALKNEDIKIDGDGSQTRSFCYSLI